MDAFIGEIRAFGFGYAPMYWLPCDGRQLQVTEYQALYSVIGNTYGGTGGSTFNLPDLRGLVPLGMQPNSIYQKVGTTDGDATVTLDSPSQIPSHDHSVQAYNRVLTQYNGMTNQPTGNFLAAAATTSGTDANIIAYCNRPIATTTMHPLTVGYSPLSLAQAHPNMMPFLAMNLCICTDSETYPLRP